MMKKAVGVEHKFRNHGVNWENVYRMIKHHERKEKKRMSAVSPLKEEMCFPI